MKAKLIIINLLTLIRVIGVVLLIPIYQHFGGFYVGLLALICYFTDSLDGLLARKWQASTFFGALFDGTADKLFTIANFIVLYLITPYAIIPIVIELLIVLILLIKLKSNLNLKSNIIGKFKVWILAICIVLTFIISDINNINFISQNLKSFINNLNSNILYLSLLAPSIIMEILTLISYILEIKMPKNIKKFDVIHKEIEIPKLGKNKWQNFKSIWLNPEFYEIHKNDTNLKKLIKLK